MKAILDLWGFEKIIHIEYPPPEIYIYQCIDTHYPYNESCYLPFGLRYRKPLELRFELFMIDKDEAHYKINCKMSNLWNNDYLNELPKLW